MSATRSLSAFAAMLPGRGRLIALDHSPRRVGVAISDSERTLALPLLTIPTTRPAGIALQQLVALLGERQPCALVIGWPVRADGSPGPRSQSVAAFNHNLEQRGVDLPTLFHDERMSTRAVQKALVSADIRPSRRKKTEDSLAAAWFLQTVLESLRTLHFRQP